MASVDLSSDPTYPRSSTPCPQCGHPESILVRVSLNILKIGIFCLDRISHC